MKKILSIFLLIISFGYASATTFYVSNSGSNSNSGTSTIDPWQTNSKVNSSMSSFNAGDQIFYKCGDVFTGTLNVTRSGSSGNPIVFGIYGTGNLPKFTGTASTQVDFCTVTNKNYVTFNGWEIYDPTIDTTLTGTSRTQISHVERAFVFDGSTNCVIQNCKIRAVGCGMLCNGAGSACTLQYNYLADLTMIKDDVGNGDDDYGANPFVIATHDNTIIHNYFNRCYGHSHDYTLDGGNDIVPGSGSISGNVVMWNRMNDCIGAIEMKGDFAVLVFAYNILTDCGQAFTFQTGTQNIGVYNNCFVAAATERPGQATSIYAGMSGSDAIDSKNNIYWLANTQDVASSGSFFTAHKNNIARLYSGSVWGYTTDGSEQTITSATWVSQSGTPDTWDYHLLTGSVAIGGATSVSGLSTKDIFGNEITANIGAVGPAISTTTYDITFPVNIGGTIYTNIN